MIQLTEQMFEDAKRMAALDERRRIKENLREYVSRSGDRILLVNFEGDLGLLDQHDFHHLDAIFKRGNSNPTSS